LIQWRAEQRGNAGSDVKRQRLLNSLWIFGIFLILAAFFASETYVWYWVKGKPPAFWASFRFNMARWYPWAFLTPLIIHMVRRYPFHGRRWPVSIMMHLGLNGLSAMVVAVVYGVTRYGWTEMADAFLKHYTPVFINLLHYNVLAYWLIAVIAYLVEKLRLYREKELRLTREQASLSQAQYRFLSRQIRPHFLFNTLHALSALIHMDINQADILISRFSDFLRRALDEGGLLVPLERELEIIRIFVDIEKIRFGHDFDAVIHVDPECLDCPTPNMLLQPLLEVIMGQEGRPMRLEMRMACMDNHVQIEITRVGEKPPRIGVLEPRLIEIRQRLNHAYADGYSLLLLDEDLDRVSARLQLPCTQE